MKKINPQWIALGSAGVLAFAMHAAVAREDGPAEKAMPQVRNVFLNTNGCTPQLTKDLQKAKYNLVPVRKNAEAVMTVDVHQLDAHTGASARYSATLKDQADQQLFTTSGRMDSISQEELCEDISEGIADRLEDRMEAIK